MADITDPTLINWSNIIVPSAINGTNPNNKFYITFSEPIKIGAGTIYLLQELPTTTIGKLSTYQILETYTVSGTNTANVFMNATDNTTLQIAPSINNFTSSLSTFYDIAFSTGSVTDLVGNKFNSQSLSPYFATFQVTDVADYSTATMNLVFNLNTDDLKISGVSYLDALTGFKNVISGSGNDLLIGDATANTLVGGLGNDTIRGGAGRDVISVGTGVASATDGIDQIRFTDLTKDSIATDTSIAGVDWYKDLTLNGASADRIGLTVGVANVGLENTGSVTESTFVADMNALLTATGKGFVTNIGTGIDAAIVTANAGGLSGRKFLAIDLDGNNTFTANDFVIEITGSNVPTVTATTLSTGTSLTPATFLAAAIGGQVINGTPQADTLIGGAGDDTITGLAGNDSITGGFGRDIVSVGTGAPSTTDGNDVIVFNDITVDTTNLTVASADSQVINNANTTNSLAAVDWYKDLILNGSSADTLSLPIAVTKVGTAVTGSLSEATFIANMNTLLNVSGGKGFDTSSSGVTAAVITANAGDLLNRKFLAIDLNGDNAFTATDFVIEITGSTVTSLTTASFGSPSATITDTPNHSNPALTGGAGNDIIYGLDLNDTIDGGAGADAMYGGTGDDVYYVDNPGDAVIENVGEGIDTVYSSITYTLPDNVENLVLTGTTAINATGNILNNVITGNSASNALTGGAGIDTFNITGGSDSITDLGVGGADAINITAGNVSATLGNNWTATSATNNATTGTASIDAAGFSVTLTNAIGNGWTITNSSTGTFLIGSSKADSITGGSGIDMITGGGGNDSLKGGGGADTFTVDSGTDTIADLGVGGTDSLIVNPGATVNAVLGAAWSASSVTDNEGTATLSANGFNVNLSAATVAMATTANPNPVGWTINNTNSTGTVSSIGINISGSANADSITGGAGIDTIDGGTGKDTIGGGPGNDVLSGGADDDLLIGGVGNDVLTGGTGVDTFNINSGSDTITDLGLGGVDIVTVAATTTVNATLGANWTASSTSTNAGAAAINAAGFTLDLSNAAGINGWMVTTNATNTTMTGSANADTMTGDAGNDVIMGNAGNDSLNGGLGNDTLTGGVGNDTLTGGGGVNTFNIDTGSDTITDLGSGGADTLNISSGATVNATLTGGWTAPNTTMNDGTANINANGNTVDLSNASNSGSTVSGWTVTTNATGTYIAGSDYNDTITGGAGADTIYGGLGKDIVTVHTTGDTSYNSILFKDTGNDSVATDTSVAGVDWYKDLKLNGSSADTFLLDVTVDNVGTAVTGTVSEATFVADMNSRLTTSGKGFVQYASGISAAIVTAASGTLVGRTFLAIDTNGDNAFTADDFVIEITGFTPTGSGLTTASFKSLSSTGTAGNDTLTGTAGNDSLFGDAGNDSISGLAGDDTLDGGTGVDTLVGGTGDDIYYVDASNDVVTENSGEGNDTVYSTSTYTIPANVENLILNDTTNINGTGNGLDNYITGNTGNNLLSGAPGNDTLNGGGGLDTLFGGAGDDVYIVDSTTDKISEAANAGTDTVLSSVTFDLSNANVGNNVENLTLQGISDIDGTGNAADNTITGNDGDNNLSGNDGNDTLIGAVGNDILDGGTGDDSLNGGIGDDLLVGGDGNDTLDGGGAGTDTLIGGAGNDTYMVDSTTDTITEQSDVIDPVTGLVTTSYGNDTVISSVSYTLGDNLENLTLTGTDTIDGRGNDLDNLLNGNDAANSLVGGSGDDTINGGGGDDTIAGGRGKDTVTVGGGNNLITFASGVTDTSIGDGTTAQMDLYSDLTFDGSTHDKIGVYSTITSVAAPISGFMNNGSFVKDMNFLLSTAGQGFTAGGIVACVVTATSGDLAGRTFLAYDIDDNGQFTTDDFVIEITGSTFTGAGLTTDSFVTLQPQLNGTPQDDFLTGTDSADLMFGYAGNDTIDGGLGADTMVGGADNDLYIVDDPGDAITELPGGGTDTVQTNISYTLPNEVENLELTDAFNIDGTGNDSDNYLKGNSGNNNLFGMGGNDTLQGGGGVDTLIGGIGDDTYLVDSTTDTLTENAGEGTDTVISTVDFILAANNNIENLTLSGAAINGAGNELDNVITGNALANSLSGGLGNDTLDGGLGADTMVGDGGSDVYIVDNTGDVVVETGTVAGEIDTVQSSITYTLAATLENLTLTGTNAIDGLGNASANVIQGNSANNSLLGGGGNDTLTGGDGNDTLTGGTGTGTDTFNVDLGTDTVTDLGSLDVLNVSAGATANATLAATWTATINTMNNGNASIAAGGFNVDLTNAVGANGWNVTSNSSTAVKILGSVNNDTLVGGAGNDSITGGLGRDVISTGAGNDIVFVPDADTVVTDNSIAGVDLYNDLNLNGALGDRISLSVPVANVGASNTGSLTESSFVADMNTLLTTTNKGFVQNAGGIDAAIVTANAGDLSGRSFLAVDLDGNDVFDATDFVIEITGSTVTSLTGGSNGTLITKPAINGDQLANKNDTLYGTSTDDIINGLTGNDILYGGTSTSPTTNTANDSLDGGIGTDTLYGGDGNDTLQGGLNGTADDAAIDSLVGGTGDDVYIVANTNDIIVENANEGTDIVKSSVSYTALPANVENLTLTGSTAVIGTGNASNNYIIGNSAANSLSGSTGSDTLDGGAGDAKTDTLVGGAGNDTYLVDNTNDIITEAGTTTTEIDTVQSSVTYTLPNPTTTLSYVENLTLTGTANLNGIGNSLANLITGNSGNNLLDGGTGADTLIGGAGDDIYVVDNTGDVVNETVAGSGGTDTIQSSQTYTLPTNVENLTLTASGVIGTGNTLANIIQNQTGTNTLTGGAGVDTFNVTAGTANITDLGTGEILTVNSGATATATLTSTWTASNLSSNAGTVTVTASGKNVDVSAATGTGSWILTNSGNATSLSMTGSANADSLSSGTGNDTLIGGGGNDVYTVDSSLDVITEQLNQGTDTVKSSATTYTLPANVENLVLTGTANINGTGNTLDNVITANSGANNLAGLGGNDTFSFVAANLTSSDTVDGGVGNDTVALTGNTSMTTVSNFDNVKNIEAITLGNTNTAVSITTKDTLVAAGANLTLSNAANSGVLTFVGSAETDGNFSITGGSGSDKITGGAGNDTLSGGGTSTSSSSNKDSLTGGAGNDTFVFALTGTLNSGDTLDGGIGVDTVALQSDTAIASTAFTNVKNIEAITTVNTTNSITIATLDQLVAAGATLTLDASSLTTGVLNFNGSAETNGNFNIIGGAAIDSITGGAGADTLNGGAGNDVIDGKAGTDILDLSGATAAINFTLVQSSSFTSTGAIAGLGTDTYANMEGVIGSSFADTLTGSANGDVINGGAGNDSIIANAGNDTIIGSAGTDTIDGGAGTDTLDWSSSTVSTGINSSLANTTSVEVLIGSNFNDTLTGSSLGDVINGGLGDDSISAGDGNDTIIGSAGNDTVDGGNGIDILDLSAATAGVNFVFTANYTNMEGVIGSGFNDTLTGDIGNDVIDGGVGNDVLVGGAGNDSLTGNIGNDTITGGIGDDTLIGGAGVDTFNVDAGTDTISDLGAGGADVLSVSSGATANATLTGSWTATNSTANSGTASINAAGFVVNLVSATGTNGWALTNSGSAVTITGSGQADTLTAGAGNDTLVGGSGNDVYVINSTGDVVTESSTVASEIDEVQSAITYTLGANLETLTLTGTAAINGTGNTLNNTLNGNSGNNSLDGGTGADTMVGGTGNDTYVVDNTGDVVIETSTLASEIDTVQSSVNYTLGANLENLTLTGTAAINGTGNALNNTLNGNSGNNSLDGGAGADTMVGGTGNDTYVVDNTGDVVTETSTLASEIDTVQSSVSYTLGANLENLTLTGTAAINGTGNALNNTLNGNSGNNSLDGGAGADTMAGGTGNDTYVVDNTGDVVTETSTLASEIDEVQSAVTYTLGANLETLTLTGTSAINGTGNTLNNTLNGNSGNNSLDGGAGADTMVGGTGNDTYVVDNTGDVVTETSTLASEIDTVQSSVSYTLGANLEILTLTGTAAINGTGNALNNTLNGNSGNNSLDGGAGDDTLIGGNGADTLTGGAGANKFDFTGKTDTSTDTITDWSAGDSLAGALAANTQLNVTITDATPFTASIGGNVSVIGGAGNDSITGGNGNDTLISGGGNDTLNAGTGNDSLYGVTGSDTFVLAASTGLNSNDTIIGGAGSDIVALTGNAPVNPTDFDNVNSIEFITLQNTNTPVSITTKNTLVAAGTTLTLSNANNSGVLTFNGAAETDGKFNLTGGTSNDMFTFAAGSTGLTTADTVDGNSGNDTVTLTGDVAVSATDFDHVSNMETITLGNTTTPVSITTKDSLVASGATLTLSNAASSGILTFDGSAETDGNFSITGGSGNDKITGGAGNDTLMTTGGSDSLIGGSGDDTFVFNSTSSLASSDTIDGGIGNDTVALKTNSAVIATDFNNISNIETISTVNTTSAIAITTQNTLVSSGKTLNLDASSLTTGTLNFVGTNETDGQFNLIGGAANDSFTGGANNDTFFGGAGIDIFTVNAGTDTISDLGNGGQDVLTVSSGAIANATLNANWVATPASVNNGTTLTGAVLNANGHTADLSTINTGNGWTINNSGTGATLKGSALNDSITGGSGNDILDGAGGANTLVGGNGDDVYVIYSANDVVTELPNGGYDTVRIAASYTTFNRNTPLSAFPNCEAIDLSLLPSIINGTTGDDTLKSTTANDTIDGLAGIDVLDLSGATAGINFTLIQSSSATAVDLTGVGLGSDSYKNMEGVIGTSFADTITGSTSSTSGDRLSGGGGDDTFNLVAGTGLTSADTIDGGVGSDAIVLSGLNSIAASDFDNVSNIESITVANTNNPVSITTKDALVASGMTLTLNASSLTTGILTFNGSAETNGQFNITGGAGADVITGSGGNDNLTGNGGADTFVVNGGTDTITDLGNGGQDVLTVNSGAIANATINTNWVATSASVNNGTALTGAVITANGHNADLSAINSGNGWTISNSGNATAVTLKGSSAGDSITGGTLNDNLTGNGGADTFVVNGGTDTITDLGNGGQDVLTVNSGAIANATVNTNWVATSASVNNGTALTGAVITANGHNADLSAINSGNGWTISNSGNATAVTLKGSSAGDSITGGTLNDNLTGNGGADTFVVNGGTDTITDLGNGGQDVLIVNSGAIANATVNTNWVATSASVNNGTALTGAVITASGHNADLSAINSGNGWTINNSGNATAVTLKGSSAGDSIIGGSAADTITGGAGADKMTGGAGADYFSYLATTGAALLTEAGSTVGTSATTPPSTTTADIITDFVSGTDKINLALGLGTAGASGGLIRSGSTSYTSGASLTTTDFKTVALGTSSTSLSTSTSGRFIFDTTGHDLIYDPSGNSAISSSGVYTAGANDDFVVLVVSTGVTLTASDFIFS